MGESRKRSKAYNKVKEVYRVENIKDPLYGVSHLEYGCDHWRYLPTPQDDGINYPRAKQVCATLTKKQFKEWWPSRTMRYIAEGAEDRAVILRVHPRYIKVGRHQCLIQRDKATIIGELLPNGRSFYYIRSSSDNEFTMRKSKP